VQNLAGGWIRGPRSALACATLILDTTMGLSDYRLMLSRHLLVRLFHGETKKASANTGRWWLKLNRNVCLLIGNSRETINQKANRAFTPTLRSGQPSNRTTFAAFFGQLCLPGGAIHPVPGMESRQIIRVTTPGHCVRAW
jgi:hypothetical protein